MMSISMCRSAQLFEPLLPVADEPPHGDIARGDARDVEPAPDPLRVLVEIGVRHRDGDAAVLLCFLDKC